MLKKIIIILFLMATFNTTYSMSLRRFTRLYPKSLKKRFTKRRFYSSEKNKPDVMEKVEISTTNLDQKSFFGNMMVRLKNWLYGKQPSKKIVLVENIVEKKPPVEEEVSQVEPRKNDGTWTKIEFEQLRDAIRWNNIEKLKKLVNPENINNKGPDGDTLLHQAYLGNQKVFDFLLQNGASVRSINRFGQTPLHFISRYGSFAKVKKLVVYRAANVNALSRLSETPLSQSILGGIENESLEKVKFLVWHGADVNQKNYDDKTSLHLAAEEGNVEVYDFLLSKGANPHIKDRQGKTPEDYWVPYKEGDLWVPEQFERLKNAIDRNKLETLKELVDSSNVNKKDKYKYTLLHEAARFGSVELLNFLLKQGAKVENQDRAGETPLHYAILREKIDNINALINASPASIFNMRDLYQQTPLHAAAKWGLVDVYNTLKSKGALETKDNVGKTPKEYLQEALAKKALESKKIVD